MAATRPEAMEVVWIRSTRHPRLIRTKLGQAMHTGDDHAPSRAEVSSFYASIRDYHSEYHNHKEMLAWLGIAAYVLATASVATSTLDGAVPAGVVALATVPVLGYTRRQFNLRLYASQVIWASSRLAALALAGEDVGSQLRPLLVEHVDGDDTTRGNTGTRKASPAPATSEGIGITRQIFVRGLRVVFPQRCPLDMNELVLPESVTQMMASRPQQKTAVSAESLELSAYILLFSAGFITVLVLLFR